MAAPNTNDGDDLSHLPTVSRMSRQLRAVVPAGVSRKLLTRKSFRSFRRRLHIHSALDTPFYRLAPPQCHPNELPGPPDFVGIGVQKAGTSWWFDLLTRHPAVYHRPYVDVDKERHFFSHHAVTQFTDEDAVAYANWFPRFPGTVTGEWTPDYFYYAWVPEMLNLAAPNARLLLLLRDPVERFVSGISHLNRINEGSLPEGDIVQDAFARGLYGAQLQRWFQHIPPERILILQYEQCVRDTSKELARTFSFLGIDESVTIPNSGEVINPSLQEKSRLPSDVKERFVDLYSQDADLLASLAPDLDLSLWSSTGHG